MSIFKGSGRKRILDKYGDTDGMTASEIKEEYGIPTKFTYQHRYSAWHHTNPNFSGGKITYFYNPEVIKEEWDNLPEEEKKKYYPKKEEKKSIGVHTYQYYETIRHTGGWFGEVEHQGMGEIFEKGDWYYLPDGTRKRKDKVILDRISEDEINDKTIDKYKESLGLPSKTRVLKEKWAEESLKKSFEDAKSALNWIVNHEFHYLPEEGKKKKFEELEKKLEEKYKALRA